MQALLRHIYGQRLEKQRVAKATSKKTAEAPVVPHGRNPLPDNLPREDVIYAIPAAQLSCPHCGQACVIIGEEVSEQLDYVPG